MIAIYQGEGVQWQGEIQGQRITAEQIRQGELFKFSTFIMPGGRDRPYAAALDGRGNAQIRSFVEQGGTYLGICAGAYYGAKRVEFERGSPLEVSEDRELAFFDGIATGPAYGPGFAYNSEQGARMALLHTEQGIMRVYYNGGCTFQGDLQNVKIHARYQDIKGHPPAIIECAVGKGQAFLSGVHLEKGIYREYEGRGVADPVTTKVNFSLTRLLKS